MIVRAALAALLLAVPATAQTPMTAEEFESYVTGKTLTYAEDGVVYGIEEYLPGRRVRWAFRGGECRDGIWFEQAERICFVYRDNPVPQCWTFFEGANGLLARFENAEGRREVYEAEQTDEPLVCPGPEVGV